MLEEQVGSGRHTVSIWVFACSQLRGDQMLSLIFVSQSDTETDYYTSSCTRIQRTTSSCDCCGIIIKAALKQEN